MYSDSDSEFEYKEDSLRSKEDSLRSKEDSLRSKDKEDKYAVKCLSNNKECIEQPHCCEIELLPKLPTGILCIGRSGSGKTNAVVNMLKNDHLLANQFDFTYLYTGGIKPDKDLIKDLNIPPSNIKDDFTATDVENLMSKLQRTVEKQGMADTPSVLLILDDILGNTDFLKSKTFSKLCTTNRHCRITYIIMTQYFKKLPPVCRTNGSYYMVFPSSMVELEKIAEELTPPSMNKKEFLKIAKFATKEKYSFLSINSKATPDKQLRKNFGTILSLN